MAGENFITSFSIQIIYIVLSLSCKLILVLELIPRYGKCIAMSSPSIYTRLKWHSPFVNIFLSSDPMDWYAWAGQLNRNMWTIKLNGTNCFNHRFTIHFFTQLHSREFIPLLIRVQWQHKISISSVSEPQNLYFQCRLFAFFPSVQSLLLFPVCQIWS